MTEAPAAVIGWRDWAPPLSPPADPGLPEDTAERIAAQLEGEDPHCVAAALWDAYAAGLPADAPVASVSTGVQSVAYPGGHAGALGGALARADWHRERCGGTLQSVPLRTDPPGRGEVPVGIVWPVRRVLRPPPQPARRPARQGPVLLMVRAQARAHDAGAVDHPRPCDPVVLRHGAARQA